MKYGDQLASYEPRKFRAFEILRSVEDTPGYGVERSFYKLEVPLVFEILGSCSWPFVRV